MAAAKKAVVEKDNVTVTFENIVFYLHFFFWLMLIASFGLIAES